jgi:hypothetical protein
VRLFLDAHVSGRNIGDPLIERGHSVRALDREPELEAIDDGALLELSSADERVLVTLNVADFPTILREWGIEASRHAGVILVHGIDHSEFGLVVRGVERWIAIHPEQQDWSDRVVVLSRDFASIDA